MLNVCCVAVDLENYLDGRAVEYVEILYSMVRRNLAGGMKGRFTVFTDNPSAFAGMGGVQTKLVPAGLKGWWAKLFLFSADAFPRGERVLYFDLDTVITGPLDEIAAYDGHFAILRDAYRPGGLQSSVMAWESGSLHIIYDNWISAGAPEIDGGDQSWIESQFHPNGGWFPDILQDKFPGLFKSYKLSCQDYVPKGTSVVFFHGRPRPHECDGWVKDVWKLTDQVLFFSMNVKEEQVRANIKHALSKPKWIEMRDGLQNPAIIVGGAPSLEHSIWRIKGHQMSGGKVFATNGAFKYLKEHGVTPDAHVMHDARLQNIEFVPLSDTTCYYASQCDPVVLDAAGDRLVCWHPHSDIAEELALDGQGKTMVHGGSTVGLNAISLAYILGHRNFLLFGFDSSYSEASHHAYEQRMNDGETVIECEAHGHIFLCAPWMVQQAEQFVALTHQLTALGCDVRVFGKGLIPVLAANMQPPVVDADFRAGSLLRWLEGVPNPVGVEIGVFAGDLSKRLLTRADLTLYLVDPWTTTAPESPYTTSGDFHAKLSQAQQNRFMEAAQNNVRFAGNRARFIRKFSVEAADDFVDGSLDFVFIDGDHSYEGCRADIEAWLPKVKPGGFISGHDYSNTDFPCFGVNKAVDERFGSPELGENFTWRVKLESNIRNSKGET